MKRHIIRLLIVFLVLFYSVPVRYPIPVFTPIKGLDVSHHQGTIDWTHVHKSEVHFAYIKASEGGDFRDTQFQRNWLEAKKNGIPRGAYHFLTFCKSGKEQARNFIDAVGSFDTTDLIPMIDVEYGGNCSQRLTLEELQDLIEEFTAELMTVSKHPPVIYLTRDIYRDYFYKNPFPNKFWGRAIIYSPSRVYGNRWDIWQYNHKGRVEGIEGPVDLNVLKSQSLDHLYNR